MPDLRDRFGALDALGSAPDVWARATQMGPRTPQPESPEGLRRVGIVVLALAVAVAGVGLVVRSFSGADRDGKRNPSPAVSQPTPTDIAGSVYASFPTPAGAPDQTTAIAASRHAVWVASYDARGGHLVRLDPDTLTTVAVIDDLPAPGWESGGGGLTVAGNGTVWVGGEGRLVAIDERTNEVVVDRSLAGCCADVSADGGLGFYAYATTTDGGGVIYWLDPDSGRTLGETRVPGLTPRRIVPTASGYVGVVAWETAPDGGITGSVAIPVHFEGMPATVDGLPRIPLGSPQLTSGGWTTGAEGLDRLDETDLFRPIAHVDLPIGRIDLVADGPRGVWVFGHDGSILVVDRDDARVLYELQASDGWGWNAVASRGDTMYLLGRDGRVTSVRLA
jgi:hypothetical protein